jgi:hypothetical protein
MILKRIIQLIQRLTCLLINIKKKIKNMQLKKKIINMKFYINNLYDKNKKYIF